MKILIVSYEGYGIWYSLRLEKEGHSVDIYLTDKSKQNILQGIAPEVSLEKPDFKKYDLVLFDSTGKPALAEDSIDVTPTIGDGDLNSQLEDDRQFGIEVMEEVGINVPFYEEFDNIGEAKRFVKKTNKTYVFKPNAEGVEQDTAATYVSSSADDLINYLDRLGSLSSGASFILQEVVQGTEVSTEAYFNGEEFFLINATLEEKKFMNDGKGPNTGCAGNLVWVYDQPPALFKQGLGLMKDFLHQYDYHGMIDLNTIVTGNKIYGLEWTPRFGYDASPTLFSLLSSELAGFMYAIASGDRPNYNLKSRFAAGVRISIPPYPSEIKGQHPEQVPINGIDEDDLCHCYMYDAMLDGDELVTAGISGFIAVPLGTGTTIAEAFYKVNQKLSLVKVPNMQYRTDIERRTLARYNTLLNQGWLR